MTINEAFQQLITSEDFKTKSRSKEPGSSTYRVQISRFNNGTLSAGALVDILLLHGYEITAKKTVRKKKRS